MTANEVTVSYESQEMHDAVCSGCNDYKMDDLLIDRNLIGIIISFATGYIFDCCNKHCENKQEISIGSQYDYDNCIDHDGNKIYWYTLAQYNHLDSVDGINGQRIRIFCNLCCIKLKKCDKGKCSVQEMEDVLIKYELTNDRKRFFCHNHPKCIECGQLQEMTYDDKMINCKKCINIVHQKCSENEICGKCLITSERKNIFNPIHDILRDILDLSIMDMIVEFAMGFAVICAHCGDKNEEIYFENKWQFNQKKDQHERRINYYPLTKYNKLSSVDVYGKKIRVLCNICSPKAIKCARYECYNKDLREYFYKNNVYRREYYICHNHPRCIICNGISLKETKCYQCSGILCTACSHKDCPQCMEIEQLKMKKNMFGAIKMALNDILYNDLIDIIVVYGIGYIFMCCNTNKRRCDNEIFIYSNYELRREVGRKRQKCLDLITKGISEGHYYYKLKEKDRLLIFSEDDVYRETENGEKFRIFCQECKGKLKYCGYNKCSLLDVEPSCFNHPYCTICKNQLPKECDACFVSDYDYDDSDQSF